jgi:hypothetical protein
MINNSDNEGKTKTNSDSDDDIKDFESCAKKFPILETYPEQCKTDDGKIFVKNY